MVDDGGYVHPFTVQRAQLWMSPAGRHGETDGQHPGVALGLLFRRRGTLKIVVIVSGEKIV